MGIYERLILPRIIHLACGSSPITKQRQKVVPLASGKVLDVGTGSGHNLPLYEPEKVQLVWGLEPNHGMRDLAGHNVARSHVELHWLDLPGEKIPLHDHSVDTVVLTYTLCTIPDWRAALAQMLRVLKPEGRLLFLEHGAAPDAAVRRWQDRLNPGWRRCAGGCNLNRDIPALLREAGFEIVRLETMYLPGTPRIAGYNYWGEAIPCRANRARTC
jgi:ubiquinone/menaquinone biosynthesis C-methylase UbiE